MNGQFGGTEDRVKFWQWRSKVGDRIMDFFLNKEVITAGVRISFFYGEYLL